MICYFWAVTSGYGGGSDSLNNLLRLLVQGEPLFAQLETVNKYYLRLKDVSLTAHAPPTIHTPCWHEAQGLITRIRAEVEHLIAEIGFKREHLFAETAVKGEHLFAETEIKGEHLSAGIGVGNWKHSGLATNVKSHLSTPGLEASNSAG